MKERSHTFLNSDKGASSGGDLNPQKRQRKKDAAREPRGFHSLMGHPEENPVDSLVGRAASDSQFRARLFEFPSETASQYIKEKPLLSAISTIRTDNVPDFARLLLTATSMLQENPKMETEEIVKKMGEASEKLRQEKEAQARRLNERGN